MEDPAGLRDRLVAAARRGRRSVALQVAGRFAVVLLLAYGALRFADRLFLGPGPPAAVAHPVPRPGARDSLNPAVWVAGGSFRSPPFFLRAANRSNDYLAGFTGRDIGFRVVWKPDRWRPALAPRAPPGAAP